MESDGTWLLPRDAVQEWRSKLQTECWRLYPFLSSFLIFVLALLPLLQLLFAQFAASSCCCSASYLAQYVPSFAVRAWVRVYVYIETERCVALNLLWPVITECNGHSESVCWFLDPYTGYCVRPVLGILCWVCRGSNWAVERGCFAPECKEDPW